MVGRKSSRTNCIILQKYMANGESLLNGVEKRGVCVESVRKREREETEAEEMGRNNREK